MGYSGWRFSCDRGTLERCAGALEIRAKEADEDVECPRPALATYLFGAARALRAIVEDGDGIDPVEFAARVEAGLPGEER